MPLPTGGCASAACRMVHTISSIRALSCLSDNTAETDERSRRNKWEDTESQIVSEGQKQREGLRRDRESFREQHLIASSLITACDVVLDVKKPKATFLGLKREQEQCVTYPPLPAQPPPTEVQPYTPSLSAAPESFPTMSPPGRLHAHGATHAKGNEEHDPVSQALCEIL